MKIYKITEASDYLGVSINTLKTLANNGKINSFKTTGKQRRDKMMDRMNRRERFVVKDSDLIYYRGAKYRKTLRKLDIAMWVVVVLMAAATLIIEWVY